MAAMRPTETTIMPRSRYGLTISTRVILPLLFDPRRPGLKHAPGGAWAIPRDAGQEEIA